MALPVDFATVGKLLDAFLIAEVAVIAYLAYGRYRDAHPAAYHPQPLMRSSGAQAFEAQEGERTAWEEYADQSKGREQLIECLSRRNELEDMRREARKQFMKRSIDDVTYRGLILSLEKELLEVNHQIKMLEEETPV